MQQKLYLFIFGSVLVLALLLVLSIYFSSIKTRSDVYYIPQLSIYIKTVQKANDEYGYILFSKKRYFENPDSIDYVQVYKNISNNFIVNPTQTNIIYYCNQIKYNGFNGEEYTIIGKPKKINEVKFIFKNINETDTLFFEKRYLTNPIIVKKPYIEISILEKFDHIVLKVDNTITKIQTVK